MLMPQQATNLGQTGAVAQHLASQGVAELMCSCVKRTDLRPSNGSADERAYAGRRSQAAYGRVHAQEQGPQRTVRSPLVQILRNGPADILRQR